MGRALGRIFVILACVVSFGLFSPAEAKRVALVIGNSTYDHATPLANPKNDAIALSAALERLGFEVFKGVDLKRSEFERTVRDFARSVRGADAALFFYAGHGLQVGGRNYLAPVDAKLSDEADLDFETLPLHTILKQMEREVKTNLVFLDACRDNPLARNLARSMGTRSAGVGRGLARVDSGVGTLIAFATEPGNVALDGKGSNSPFTEALLKHIETPGIDVDIMLRQVRREVLAKTAGRQVPWSNSSLTGRFEFAPRKVAATPKPAERSKANMPGQEPFSRAHVEVAYWNSVRESSDIEDFKSYLSRYPDGTFAEIATRRIAALEEPPSEQADPVKEQALRETVTLPVRLGKMPIKDRNTAWLGVRIANIQGVIQDCYELNGHSGAYVASVTPDSPADKAGLLPQDVIQRLDGKSVGDIRALVRMVGLEPIGATVRIDVLRLNPPTSLLDSLATRAEQHDAVASHCLGKIYAQGYGIKEDDSKAIEFFRMAADDGSSEAMRELGDAYKNGAGVTKDLSTSTKWYRKAAEHDDVPSLLQLASFYATGTGVEHDERMRRTWLEKAMALGSSVAMSDLGWLQQHGKAGFSKDPGKAFKLYEQAANKGNNNGRYNLGLLYETGNGVGQDASEAFKWYRKAADDGHIGAMLKLGNLYSEGKGIGKNDREAVNWYSKAVDRKDNRARYVLAWHYENGRGVAKDPKIAAQHMLVALTMGEAEPLKQMTTNANAWSVEFRRELQTLMREKGVYTGAIDGQFGPGTKRAIEALAKPS